MKKIYYALYHVYEDKQTAKDEEKFIGLFSTVYRAREAIGNLRFMPGFNQFPKRAFEIYPVEVDDSNWNEGFVTTYYYE